MVVATIASRKDVMISIILPLAGIDWIWAFINLVWFLAILGLCWHEKSSEQKADGPC